MHLALSSVDSKSKKNNVIYSEQINSLFTAMRSPYNFAVPNANGPVINVKRNKFHDSTSIITIVPTKTEDERILIKNFVDQYLLI